MDRRTFLDTLLWTSLAGAAASALAPLPFYLVPPKSMLRVKRIAFSKPAKGAARKFDAGDRVVIAVDDGTLRVFDARCTHQGCPVDWDAAAGRFACHCHGALFDVEGRPTKGPAKAALAKLNFREVNGEIIVE